MIYSIPLEREVLGGLIKHPKIFTDIDVFVNPNDFSHDIHGTIYSVLKNIIGSGETPNKVILAQKLKNLGLNAKDGVDIFEYIDSLAFTQITEKAIVKSCQELVAIRIRREVGETAQKIIALVKTPGDKNVQQIISEADALYNGKISAYEVDSEPVNIFNDIEEFIEERGNRPVDEIGIPTPFPEFNRLYGGLKGGERGNLYAFVSRSGVGKSTILNHIIFHSARLAKKKTMALILDTEMDTVDVKLRMLAALTKVPMWYLETGNWRKETEMCKKVREALPIVKNYELFHFQVGNKNIDEICSIIRRWYFSKVGRGNQAIVSYDYIKLTGEKVGQNWAEHQAIGEKVQKLKDVSGEINSPLLTAMQLNRSGESFGRKQGDFNDDASAISLSDRLQWFTSFCGIFRQKTLDEIALDGPNFGTHKLIKIKSRHQGRDAAGHQDFFKRKDAQGNDILAQNYINYQVENFWVEEKGSLRDVIDNANANFKVKDGKDNKDDQDGGLL